ncbi:MAG: type II secretion system F family protein [Acidimicrobiia bacterium]|nr:type II secretion system F family protein [Acidimicrobiia bacterium]
MTSALAALAAALAAFAVYRLAAARSQPGLGDLLAEYLRPATREPGRLDRHERAKWGPATAARLGAAALGAGAGALFAAGHLFTSAIPSQAPVLIGLGAAAGLLAQRISRKRAAETRAARLLRELPTVADTLALAILAGESVAGAIERFAGSSRGVAAEELGEALGRHRAGDGLPEALARATGITAHPEGGRLYDLLGHAHHTGGRLADSLSDLAVDYRAALARDLTAEGGRRALAAYGPILALMVPVTLLFLMYPTLAGLAALSSPSP